MLFLQQNLLLLSSPENIQADQKDRDGQSLASREFKYSDVEAGSCLDSNIFDEESEDGIENQKYSEC